MIPVLRRMRIPQGDCVLWGTPRPRANREQSWATKPHAGSLRDPKDGSAPARPTVPCGQPASPAGQRRPVGGAAAGESAAFELQGKAAAPRPGPRQAGAAPAASSAGARRAGARRSPRGAGDNYVRHPRRSGHLGHRGGGTRWGVGVRLSTAYLGGRWRCSARRPSRPPEACLHLVIMLKLNADRFVSPPQTTIQFSTNETILGLTLTHARWGLVPGAGHSEGRSKYLVGEAGDGLAPLPARAPCPPRPYGCRHSQTYKEMIA